MNRNYKFRFLLVMGLVLIVSVFTGCKGGKKASNNDSTPPFVQDNASIIDDIQQAEKVFHALPSPLEAAMLIKSAGAPFKESLLNPLSNANSYMTTKAKALNLGVYTCDLSYSSMYEQTQLIVDYMNAAKKMADGLGILDAISEEDINTLEENINDSEVIMDIVSQTALNSNSYLEDNGERASAAMVLLGGWLEGFYFSTQLVDMTNLEGNKLVSRIIDQKSSMDDLMNLLDSNKDDASVAELIQQMNELKVIFDKVSIQQTSTGTEYDQASNATLIKSNTTSSVTPAVFKELCEKVASIRNSFVKP